MITFVCDTSNSTCCAGLYEDGRELSYEISFEKKTHSETFAPLVERVLCKAGKTVKDIDVIAATEGPGSFTGIRIGLSFVKGLCAGIPVKVIPVSSLRALARSVENIAYDSADTILIPSFDARNKRIFACALEEDDLSIKVPEGAYFAEEFAHLVKKVHTKKIIVLGDGADTVKEAFRDNGIKAEYAKDAAITPRGIYEASKGIEPQDAASVTASYLAVSSAERLQKK